ncbi:uncharacterized protein LOC118645202 [Monomorium pharaonis]|uniref:uncharacterized protein LOC118645202 n=1 Tax=Monomorium pharaonis TaxID=307658 RepID=UPI001747BEE6|nr:uncharacterized protein LOC118645202 [Monomorium pharaonis]
MTTPVSIGSSSRSQSQSLASVDVSTNELLLKLLEQHRASDAKFSAFIEEQRRTNQEINAKLNQLNVIAGNVERNSQRITSLEQSCATIARDVGDLKSHQRSSELDSHSRTHNMLIISGVPSTLSITPLTLVRNVFTKLGIPELSCHILEIRTIARESGRTVSHDRPLPISTSVSLFVTLASVVVRDIVISRKRARRVLVQSEVCENDSGGNIYVNDLLPKNIYELLKQTKHTAKKKSYHYVWVSRGRINVRRSDGEPVIRVDSVADLDKLA